MCRSLPTTKAIGTRYPDSGFASVFFQDAKPTDSHDPILLFPLGERRMRFFWLMLVALGLFLMILSSVGPLEGLTETAYDESEALPFAPTEPGVYATFSSLRIVASVQTVPGNRTINVKGSPARDRHNCLDGRNHEPQKFVSLLCTLIC